MKQILEDSASIRDVHDYAILHLAMPTTQSFTIPTNHIIYVQPNSPKFPTSDTPRELFIVNIPIDSTLSTFRNIFKEHLGGYRIESISFEGPSRNTLLSTNRKRKQPNQEENIPLDIQCPWPQSSQIQRLHHSGSTCILTFVDVISAQSAMATIRKTTKSIPWSDNMTKNSGLERYKSLYKSQYPSTELLQAAVDNYMSQFSNMENERSKSRIKLRQEPDEDGFVTVVKGGNGIGAGRSIGNLALEEELKEKLERQAEKRKPKDDFYRFQMRERFKDEAIKLRRGFEKQREKVAEMRKVRNKFKPNDKKG